MALNTYSFSATLLLSHCFHISKVLVIAFLTKAILFINISRNPTLNANSFNQAMIYFSIILFRLQYNTLLRVNLGIVLQNIIVIVF